MKPATEKGFNDTDVSQPHAEMFESSEDSSEEPCVPGLLDSIVVKERPAMFSPYHQVTPIMHQHFSPVFSPMMNQLRQPELQYMPMNMNPEKTKSYPVFDMRHGCRISNLQFRKINIFIGNSVDDLKTSVSKQFQASSSKIHVIEETGKTEGALMKTIIIILPENSECCYTLIIECYGNTEQVLPQMICCRLPVTMKLTEVKNLVAGHLKWKMLALCADRCILDEDCSLRNSMLTDFDRIQAVNQDIEKVEFYYQPRSDVISKYIKKINTCQSVKQVKDDIEAHFKDELAKQKSNECDVLHFCYKGQFLDDRLCIGLVLSANIHNEGISVYFAPEDSIYITLQYKSGRYQKQQLMIIAKQTSTADLRFEVSKYLNVDPKAVKLTFEKKFIDEHTNLHQIYGEKWTSGIVLVAGIKKRKTIRIRHPIHGDEKAFEMYMLEPVSVLKNKVAKEWNLNHLEISLYLRDIMMKEWQPLQFYPIKNNMEIVLQLYPRRIEVKVVVLKPKTKVKLIVNDKSLCTVEELLRFCAHKFRYARQRSRGIFKYRCLNRSLTLEQEGIQSDDTIVVAYFNQPMELQGSLINIFMVDLNGHTIKRIGTINSGILLHAPKCISAPAVEDNFEVLDNGPEPCGIYVCDGPCLPSTFKSTTHAKKQPQKNSRRLSLELSLSRKPEFLRRARSLMEPVQRRRNVSHNLVKQSSAPCFYLPEDDENTESVLSHEEFSIDEETERKVPFSSKGKFESDCSKKLLNDTEGESRAVGGGFIAENMDCSTLYKSPDFDSLLDSNRLHKGDTKANIVDKDISNPHDMDKMNNGRKDTNVENPHSDFINQLSTDAKGSVRFGLNKNDQDNGKACNVQSQGSSGIDSDIEDVGNQSSQNEMSKSTKWMLMRQNVKRRVHTSSEGSGCSHTMVPNQSADIPLNRTFPGDCRNESDNHLYTSGITKEILYKVGKHVGKKWRLLLRSLNMDDGDIDSLEYQYGNTGLGELGCQAMVAWKQTKGKAASLNVLVAALEDIGLKSIAEQYCTSGFHTM